MIDETQMRADLATYVQFGHQRSGGAGERAAFAWLAQSMGALGYSVREHLIDIETLSDPFADLEIAGAQRRAFVQWMPEASAWGRTLTGSLVAADDASRLNGAIAVWREAVPAGAYWDGARDASFRDLARAGALAAIITVRANGDIYAYNRSLSAPPFPLPVLIVDAAAHRDILEALPQNPHGSVRLRGARTPAQTRTMAAQKPGSGGAIVISTPMTGWFGCGAERGAGIVLMRALAALLRANPRPIVFLGTGGHEIGHLGMDWALEHAAPAPEETALWLHLGSSIAARAGRETTLLHRSGAAYATPPIEEAVRALFTDNRPPIRTGGPESPGETGQVIARNYARVLGFAGAQDDFHTPRDDGSLLDIATLAAIGERIHAFVQQSALR